MEKRTEVKSIKVRRREERFHQVAQPTVVETYEPPKDRGMFHADRLLRDLAVVGGLMLTLVAVRSANVPQVQSVFSALQQSAGMEWDESIGKLSFVDNMFPQEIRTVWSERAEVSVYAPVEGRTVHAWSEQEPYVEYLSTVTDVRAAADGEVMSIAHGLGEERILRLRHDDGSESLYGNLGECLAEVGDLVYAGDVIASVLPGEALAFELRVDGRSVDPDGLLLTQP